MQHVLERNVEIDRTHWRALRHFAGAHHHVVERVGAGDGLGPFGHRLEQALVTTGAEPAVPLRLNVEVRILTEALQLARHDDHRNFRLQGAVNPHAALQETDAGMQQHCLRAAGHQ